MLRLNSLCDGTGNQFDHDRESIRGKQGLIAITGKLVPFAAMKHLFIPRRLLDNGWTQPRAVATDNHSAYTKRGGGRRLPLPDAVPYYTEDASVLQAPSDDVIEKWEIIRI